VPGVRNPYDRLTGGDHLAGLCQGPYHHTICIG
jgi:hypothetical protein